MPEYRLTQTARADIVSIFSWCHEQFGEEARKRYEALIAAASRDAASRSDDGGNTLRPELGEGVVTWHLSCSRARAPGGRVHRPRHFLVCRRGGDPLVIGRVLRDAMDLRRHVDPRRTWN